MQAPMSRYTSSLQCFVTTMRLEGIRALYKGMVSPLLGNGPINAIVFASYGTAMRQFDAAVGTAAAERHKFVSIGVAGALAGLCQGPISSPVELLKCKLQVRCCAAAGAAFATYSALAAGPGRGARDLESVQRAVRLLAQAHGGVWFASGRVPGVLRDPVS
jgi:hypothetical protein